MTKFLAITFILLLTACGGGSGGGGAQDPDKPDNPIVGDKEPEWGELRCQKSQSCQNLVLNQSKDGLIYFFSMNFSEPQELDGADRDFSAFQCGIKFQEKWTETFVTDQNDIPFEKLLILNSFALEILDPYPCQTKANVEQNLQNYFKSTEEYKNEIQ